MARRRPPPAEDAHLSMIGRQIGRYRLTEEIGRGGMGIVYKATQVTLNRTVAVKMLPHDLASSGEYLARFAREAETLASLQHPNIVHIYDVEESDGDHFIVMEYVGGPPLTKRLQAQGRLDAHEVRSISMALASALEAAHRKDIIHRDIKPDNILFSEDGTPKLTDFGIARMRDSNVKTQTGVMLGTPYYMSPEQVSGTEVVGASDVYSLGVVMYEMLSGRVPFTASTPVAVALKHLQEAATPIASLVPNVPPKLGAIVDRAMAKEVTERFPSAQSFRAALRSLSLGAGPRSTRLIACPRCGAGLQSGFRACPNCAVSLEGLGEIGAVTAAESVGTDEGVGDPGAAVRKVAGTAREVAEGGLEHLSAAGEVVADSAGAAWSVVARSAGAVWSAVAGDANEDGSEENAVERVAAVATGVDGSVPGLSTPGLAFLLPESWRARVSEITPIMWAGLALVLAGILTAAALAVASAVDRPSIEIAVLPPAAPPSGPPTTRRSTFGPVQPPREQTQPPGNAGREGRDESDTPADRREPESRQPDDAEGTPATEEQDPVKTTEGDKSSDEPSVTPIDSVVTPDVDASIPGFDEVAARQQINGIVERQRRATEENDEALYLLDMDREARSADGRSDRDRAARGLEDLHDNFEDVTSEVTNVRVTFADPLHATAQYHARLSAIPEGDSDRRVLVDSDFTWKLEFKRGRWLIVTF